MPGWPDFTKALETVIPREGVESLVMRYSELMRKIPSMVIP
jgi:hypothetical protein